MNTQQKKKSNLQKPSGYRMMVLTRHGSYAELKSKLPRLPFQTVSRFGSTTVLEDVVSKGGKRVEINEISAVKNSASKLLMKKCFTEQNVKTAEWWFYKGVENSLCSGMDNSKQNKFSELPYPVIVKSFFGSRGEGNYMMQSEQELINFYKTHDIKNYIVEKYLTNYNREYRLHINALDETCFYTCRKMLKSDTPEKERYQRHSDTCVWIIEENPLFDRPVNWDKIVEESVKAVKSVGLDIGAVDVIMQTSVNKKTGEKRTNPLYCLCETSSAPSQGTITTERYLLELPKIAYKKAKMLTIFKS